MYEHMFFLKKLHDTVNPGEDYQSQNLMTLIEENYKLIIKDGGLNK